MRKPWSLALGALLGLPACINSETQPPPQDAGADAPIDAPIDAPTDAPPDPPAVCASPCAEGERCVEGACQAVDVLNLNLGESITYESGAEYDIKTRASACGTLAGAPWNPVLPAPLGAEGPCNVWNYAPGAIPPQLLPQPTATGGVTITTPTGTFLLPSMGADCSTGTPAFDLFAQSGAIAVDGDGSGHFPLFHVEVTPPLPLGLTSTPLVRGQPLTLTWQAASSAGIAINVVTLPQKSSAGTAPWIRCDAPDTGSLTISAALTSLLDPGGTYANILGSRSVRVAQEPASSQVMIHVSMTRTNQLLLDYTP